MSRTSTMLLALAVLALVIGATQVAGACPNCKDAYLDDGGGTSVASGYNATIMMMIAVPFVLLGTFTLVLRRAMRRMRGGSAAMSADTAAAASLQRAAMPPGSALHASTPARSAVPQHAT